MRKAIGRELAREAAPQADIVVPVPDSGVPAALGFAQEAGLPFEMGIIRKPLCRPHLHPADPDGARTRRAHEAFRQPRGDRGQAHRARRRQPRARGTTSVKIVKMMRDAGAREVHFRIASPPITFPDFYGIDTPEREKLLAATHDLEGMRRYIGADSLAFLSIPGLYRAMGEDARDEACPQYTTIASPVSTRRR